MSEEEHQWDSGLPCGWAQAGIEGTGVRAKRAGWRVRVMRCMEG